MKIYLILASFLGFFCPPSLAQIYPEGNITITVDDGLWKGQADQPTYHDITLDFVCEGDRCQEQIWGYGLQFNQADHNGTVEVNKVGDTLTLKVDLNINRDPWRSLTGEANYIIQLAQQNNQLIGAYAGSFNNHYFQGFVRGTINPIYPQSLPHHQPLQPQQHPRLIFSPEDIPTLQEKAKTDYGQAIISQLQQALAAEIYYDGYGPNHGYHAAGHCFLYLLNNDPESAAIAWEIVSKSLYQPVPRLLERSSVVLGMALAYDMCYNAWDDEQIKILTSWLALESQKLIEGRKGRGWNAYSWSNWSARARSAGGLAILAIYDQPEAFFPEPIDTEFLLGVAERNIIRYLDIALGDRSFGTEGDLYTRESVYSIIPFLVAYEQVHGRDLVTGSSAAEWLLPHYLTRMVGENGAVSLPTYGRHRAGPDGSLFALGLGIVPDKFLPGVQWFFNRQFGLAGNQTFGVGTHNPIEAAYILSAYQANTPEQHPSTIFDQVLVDQQKGFFVFRNQWDSTNDFVASIYAKKEPLRGSWSFPDAGSFRIWGLGEKWAIAGPSDRQRESENVVVTNQSYRGSSEPIFFTQDHHGSGVVTLQGENWLRSFAVDYSHQAGVPGLFVVVDKLNRDGQWIMHTSGNVTISGQTFTITSPSGSTMTGTFITPAQVTITAIDGVITASGGQEFFVVMTVQNTQPPQVNITGYGLNSVVTIGQQTISFQGDRLVLTNF